MFGKYGRFSLPTTLANSGVVYLLRDEFTTDAAAPLGSPRTCEPGPGTLTIVDTTNKLSIAGGKLTAVATAARGSAYTPATIAHAGGLAVVIDGKRTGGSVFFGWTNNPTFAGGSWTGSFEAGDVRVMSGAFAIVPTSLDSSTHRYIVVRRAGGGAWFIRDGELAFVDATINTNALYPFLDFFSGAGAGEVDLVRVVNFGGVWGTDFGIATDRVATTANGNTLAAASGDGWIEHTITAATGVTQELRVRWTDDSNCIIVRMDQGAGTIKVYEVNAGVATEKTGGTTTQTWTNGTAYRVVVRLSGTGIRTWVNLTDKNVTTSTFNQSVTGVKVSHAGTP